MSLRYADYQYAECRYAECRGDAYLLIAIKEAHYETGYTIAF